MLKKKKKKNPQNTEKRDSSLEPESILNTPVSIVYIIFFLLSSLIRQFQAHLPTLSRLFLQPPHPSCHDCHCTSGGRQEAELKSQGDSLCSIFPVEMSPRYTNSLKEQSRKGRDFRKRLNNYKHLGWGGFLLLPSVWVCKQIT